MIEVQPLDLARPEIAQRRRRLAVVVVAVVTEVDDAAADLTLEAARRDHLRVEEPLGEEAVGLLAEADDGFGHGSVSLRGGRFRRGRVSSAPHCGYDRGACVFERSFFSVR